MLCLFIMLDLYIFILFLKKFKKMPKLYPLGTKTKTKDCEDETSHFIF